MPLLETKGAGSAQGFGLTVGGKAAPVYIEDVFSTYLYTGSDAPQTIQNNIDLLNNGGLVWFKHRSGTPASGYDKHILFDTQRGNNVTLSTSNTAANETGWGDVYLRFRNNGFDTGTGAATSQQYLNKSGATYASWTFRKQPKFFDVVTYTGDGTIGRKINHSLDSIPGCIIIKQTNSTGDWWVWHRQNSNKNGTAASLFCILALNNTWASGSGYNENVYFPTLPTSTQFSVFGGDAGNNAIGGTYVAYLFAHDAGGFGLSGTDNVISCGSFTTDGSGIASVTLGYEPQYLLVKRTNSTSDWYMWDSMRGLTMDVEASLFANSSAVEEALVNFVNPTATGFVTVSGLANSSPYIYIAIRRGPMKAPTSGTSVFTAQTQSTTSPTNTATAGFPVDSWWQGFRANAISQRTGDRLRGANYFSIASTGPEGTGSNFNWASNTTVSQSASSGLSVVNWLFRRAPNFFDVVCYTGNGGSINIPHNLGAVPQLAIYKARTNDGTFGWTVDAQVSTLNYGRLDNNGAFSTSGFATYSTSSISFSAGFGGLNQSSQNYVAYLFASCPGVSKVGTFFLGGSPMTIDCGFTGGARFVLIKNTNYSGGSWWVWDTARGIGAGIDPRLSLDSSAAEDTTKDWLTPNSTGFATTQAFSDSWSGGNFIYLAIA